MKSRLGLIAALLLSLTAGCLKTYVGDPEKSALDDHLTGIWQSQGGESQLWFVEPFDKHSYFVQEYGFEQKDGKLVMKGQPVTLRAWVTPLAGKQFISLKAFAPQFMISPDDERAKERYIVATYSIDGTTLTAKGVSGDFVKKYDVNTPADFEKAIREHDTEAGAYIDANTYQRVDPKQPGDVKPLLDLLAE